MRIGLIARCDNTGLGNMSWEYYRQLKIDEVLLVKASYANFPERYSDYEIYDREAPSIELLKRFLSKIDVLLTIETPYYWGIYKLAREMGVKTVLIPMYEFLENRPELDYIDLFMADSQIGYDKCPTPKRIYIPYPVNREVLPFKLRTAAKTFLHNAGHGGIMGRNGTKELTKAMRYVKSDIKLIINSQFPIEGTNDSKIILNVGNYKNYWDTWDVGDIFILPCRFGGNFLAFNEAMSCGMPVMTTNVYPHNTYLPKELLIEPSDTSKQGLYNITVEMSFHEPQIIAAAIDRIANQDITKYSNRANEYAESISWKTLKPVILDTFKKLCEGNKRKI